MDPVMQTLHSFIFSMYNKTKMIRFPFRMTAMFVARRWPCPPTRPPRRRCLRLRPQLVAPAAAAAPRRLPKRRKTTSPWIIHHTSKFLPWTVSWRRRRRPTTQLFTPFIRAGTTMVRKKWLEFWTWDVTRISQSLNRNFELNCHYPGIIKWAKLQNVGGGLIWQTNSVSGGGLFFPLEMAIDLVPVFARRSNSHSFSNQTHIPSFTSSGGPFSDVFIIFSINILLFCMSQTERELFLSRLGC